MALLTSNPGFGGIMYDRTICTNPDKRRVDLALESFPSGHTTAAFAGFGNFASILSIESDIG